VTEHVEGATASQRWLVAYSGGPCAGHAWLVVGGNTLALQPIRTGMFGAFSLNHPDCAEGPIIHLGRVVHVVHARLVPPNINGSVLVHSATRTYVASALPWYTIRKQVMPALRAAGFDVVQHNGWFGTGQDIAVSRFFPPTGADESLSGRGVPAAE
jgi:hypothetical protein